MKTILLFLFVSTASLAFSQSKIDRLTAIPANTGTFNQKYKVEFHGNFKKHKFVSIKDSITGIPKTVANKGQLDTWSESAKTFNGQFSIYLPEATAPPLLDSLKDGLYAFFYTPFPYADRDTIKMKSDAVYALIPVKNFQVNGTVKWYYPNGNLAQQSEYENNQKNGLTLVNNLGESNTKIVTQELKNYDHNLEQGAFSTFYNKLIKKNEKLLTTIPCFEQGYKANGKHVGNYSITMNGEPFIFGSFRDGEPIGHWMINQWTIKGKKLVIQPNMEFEVNDEKTLVFGNYILRNLYPWEDYMKNEFYFASPDFGYSNKNYASHWLNFIEMTSLIDEWNADLFYSGKNRFASFSEISAAQNCLGLLDKNSNGKLWDPESNYYPALIDSTGKTYLIEDVLQQCGTVYDFKKFKCYYPNGKLCFDFDFENNSNVTQSPVYRPNGKLLNEVVFSEKDHFYHYIQYDSTGTVESESLYDSNAKHMRDLDFTEKRIIDGDTLTSLRGSDWFYQRKEVIDSTLNKDIPEFIRIDYKTGKTLNSHYYNPVTKHGKHYQFEASTGTSHTLDYQYDNSFDSVTFTDKFQFLDFEIEYLAKTATRMGSQFFISSMDHFNLDYLSKGILIQKGQPVTAKFQVTLDDSGKLKNSFYRYKKGIYQVVIPKRDCSLFNEFLNTIDFHLKNQEIIDQNNSYRINEKNRENIDLKTISFSIKNGTIRDSVIQQTASKFYISKYFPHHDSLVEFNDFDRWQGYIELYHSEDSFKNNWISGISSYDSVKLIRLRLEFDLKGDTINYYFNDDFNKIQKVYTNEDNQIHRWNSVNDTIENYYRKDQLNMHFLYDRKLNTCNYFRSDGTLRTEFLIENNVLVKINRFDSQHLLEEEIFVKNGYATHSFKYFNGFLTAKINYFETDSVIPDLTGLPEALDSQLVRFYVDSLHTYGYNVNPRYYSKQGQREEITRYQNDRIVETGFLVDNKKSGMWKYDYLSLPKFQMEFHYTSYRYETKSEYKRNSYIGKYQQFDSLDNIQKSGTFYEYNSEYICTDENYVEQYIVQYDTWNYESTAGKSIYAVNYYPNGNKMNEGNLVNGKPDGLWKWYHSDGLLYEIGKYKEGKRDGRWLGGDLSKVRFMGETCLDPNSPEFKELMTTIYVTVTYYENGLRSYTEDHELGTE